MFITILICTRNRARSLRRTLESLFSSYNLGIPDWEVIVADNDSTDDTAAVCRDFLEKFPAHFRFLVEKKRGKGNALNTGIAAARGDILAMTDDDVLCAPDYIESIRTVFSQYPADGAQGRVLLDCEGGRPKWLENDTAAYMSERDFGDEVFDWNDGLSGCNTVVRTEVARKIGGYSPELGPGAAGYREDYDFSLRMRQAGYRLIYAPQIVIWHRLPRERLTKSSLRKRFFDQGRSEAYFSALPSPLWRFGIYAVKESISKEAKAIWQLCANQPALALRLQCEVSQLAGFFWQHWRFKRGVPRQLSRISPLPSGNRDRTAGGLGGEN